MLLYRLLRLFIFIGKVLCGYNTFRSIGQEMLVEGNTLLEVIFQYHYNGVLFSSIEIFERFLYEIIISRKS